MHDIKFIRDTPALFDAGLGKRGLPPHAAAILDLDQRRRSAQTRFQDGQARRNELSRQIGQVKKQGGDADALMAEVAALKDELAALETAEKGLSE